MEELLTIIRKENLWEEATVFKRNAIVVKPGDFLRKLFYVVNGVLVVTTEIEEKDQIIRFAYENSIVGALDTIIDNKATIYCLKAIKHTEVILIDLDRLESALRNTPEAYYELFRNLIRQQTEREFRSTPSFS